MQCTRCATVPVCVHVLHAPGAWYEQSRTAQCRCVRTPCILSPRHLWAAPSLLGSSTRCPGPCPAMHVSTSIRCLTVLTDLMKLMCVCVCKCVRARARAHMIQGHGMSSHRLHSADASERHAYSAHSIRSVFCIQIADRGNLVCTST